MTEIEAVFTDLNEGFSLYRPTSEFSRVADGSLRMIDASAELREAYSRARVAGNLFATPGFTTGIGAAIAR